MNLKIVVLLVLISYGSGFETPQKDDDVTTPEPEGSGFTNDPTTAPESTPQPQPTTCYKTVIVYDSAVFNQDCSDVPCEINCTTHATVEEAEVGEMRTSMEVCSEGCSELAGVPILRTSCVIINGTPDWLETKTDCNSSISDVTDPSDQAAVTVTVATNPDITSEQVDDVIIVILNGSSEENVPQDITDDYLLSVNGLLETAANQENEDASNQVKGQADTLLNTVDNIIDNVVVTPAEPYVQSLTQVSVGVVKPTGVTKISYLSTGGLDEFGIEMDSNVVGNNQITFTTESRVGFKSFASDVLYPAPSARIATITGQFYNSIVIGIDSEDVTSDNLVEMRFEMIQKYGFDENGKAIQGDGTPSCLVWQNDDWSKTESCKVEPPFNITSEFVTCQCSVARDVIVEFIYSKEEEEEEEEIPKNGLSGGAIAGIVIGCVAFVAIVMGIGFYFYKKSNNKNKVETIQLENVEDHHSAT